jgi:hypothetical protein
MQRRQHACAFGIGGDLLVHDRVRSFGRRCQVQFTRQPPMSSRTRMAAGTVLGVRALNAVMQIRLKSQEARDRAKAAIRLVLGGYIAFAALNAQAAEPAADMHAAFGNTVVSTYPDGRSQKIWLHPDGTWDGLSRTGNALAGRWNMKGEKVCLRQTKPPTLPFSYCSAFPQHPDVGVQWTSKDIGGTPIRLTLEKGIKPPGS